MAEKRGEGKSPSNDFFLFLGTELVRKVEPDPSPPPPSIRDSMSQNRLTASEGHHRPRLGHKGNPEIPNRYTIYVYLPAASVPINSSRNEGPQDRNFAQVQKKNPFFPSRVIKTRVDDGLSFPTNASWEKNFFLFSSVDSIPGWL